MNHLTLPAEDLQRLFEMYVSDCEQTDTQATLSDFGIWIDENYGGEDE